MTRGIRTALDFASVLYVAAFVAAFYATAAFAADPAAAASNEAEALLLRMTTHAATIAVLIRAGVKFARSPFAGAIWSRAPVGARPAILAALGVCAVVFEHVALGTTWSESIFVAVGGVGGAVTSHEFQERIKPVGGASS